MPSVGTLFVAHTRLVLCKMFDELPLPLTQIAWHHDLKVHILVPFPAAIGERDATASDHTSVARLRPCGNLDRYVPIESRDGHRTAK